MAQPAMLPRRPGSGAGLEDFPASLLVQSPPPSPAAAAAAAASPCPAGPPPGLSLLPQPSPAGGGGVGAAAGAQLKKKSGFQITSVTPAQISASLSSNNSVAEDTESYDDLDESHTEDFSSSEILDVSLSRATDLGEPERSSSEETLSNFHEADSPGAVSPNQPRPGPPMQQQQQQQQPRSLANGGSAHPPHGPHYAHPQASGAAPPAIPGGSPSSPSFRRLPVAGSLESARPGPTVASSVGTLAGPPVAPFHHTGAASVGATGAGAARQVSKTLRSLAAAGNGITLPGGSHPGNVALAGGVGNGTGPSSNAAGSAGPTAAGATAAGHLQPAGGTSRFRVVKLDSSLEPFKKGRWTCTEFYDKENPGPAAESTAPAKTVDALLDVASERESTSGSSVSSTLSHYTESVGSGEIGGSSGTQQAGFPGGPPPMEYGSAGPTAGPTPALPQSVSQSQLSQPHLPEVSYPPPKQGVPPAASAVPPPLTVLGGHQATLSAQQLPFTPPPAQPVPVAPQSQPLPFGQGPAQHPTALPAMSMQMAPGHVKPVSQPPVVPEYVQPQMLPASASSLQPGTAMVGSGSAVPIAQPPSMQLPVQAHLPGVPPQPVAQGQPAVPAVGAPAPLMNVGQPGSVAPVAHRPSVANQMASSMMAPSAGLPAPSQAAPPVPAGVVHPGSQAAPSALPHSLGIAPASNLVAMKAADPLVPGMAQLPPVSPVPPVGTAPVASVGLAPSKTLAQPSSMQNGNLVQNIAQPALISTSVNLPGAPNSSQFSTQAFAQAIVASRTEEVKRPTESSLVGLTQPAPSESSLGPSSAALADGNMASLFPLKVLPLTSLDGEEDSSSGASVVAIDNKIEQAMDLVKSHLMYAVREEVEVLKEQIKELIEKNNQLEQENNLLKTLASPEQLAQFQAQLPASSSPASSQTQGTTNLQPSQPAPPSSGPSA